MKKLLLILSMLMCMCFTFANAEVNYTTSQQDITIEKTIDNNTTQKTFKNYTNSVIIIAAIVYIVIAIVLIIYGVKGKVIVYRNILDVSLCVALFAALPVVWIIVLTMFFLQVERNITLIILGIMAFIWISVLLYIACITLKDNRYNPLLSILILPLKIILGLWFGLSLFGALKKGEGKTVAERKEDKQNSLVHFAISSGLIYTLMRDKPLKK
ncbi:hypothetical protein E2O24_04995 [Campylobacter volucris]|uniref:hypothetical protein n=1 Tax=Campylobacter volucris TaxID=1031542 RepID=UPI001059C825|nr:hypothetical protein [Campylobacter volucris]TDJ86730.1 hypothetical protein E2O24_04995 [Campylobacter volucris]